MKEENDIKDTGRSFHLSHVRLKPEQQIAMHQQPTWELSYVVSGEGERTIGSVCEPFHSGEVVLILPQMPHCWTFDPTKTDDDGHIENITITFSDELLETTARDFPEARPAIERLRALPDSILFVRQTSRRLAGLLGEMPSQPPSVQLFMLLQIVMLMASTSEHKVIGRFRMSTTQRHKRDIEAFLLCNYKRPVTLNDLARHAGMNQSALCKFLRQHFGRTFTQCLTDRRLTEARNLLRHSSLTIGEVCYHSGFNDLPHFCRVFRQREGMTPGEYRTQYL